MLHPLRSSSLGLKINPPVPPCQGGKATPPARGFSTGPYIQSWKQSRLSRISFGTPKTRAWDSEGGNLRSEPRRQADVYVFAFFAQKELPIDPLDFDQWKFFAVSTHKLDDHKSISLSALEELASPVAWRELAGAVKKAAGRD